MEEQLQQFDTSQFIGGITGLMNGIQPATNPLSLNTNTGNGFKNFFGWNNNLPTFGNVLGTVRGLGSLLGTIGGIYGMFQNIQLANKQMNMLDTQLDHAKQQWAEAQKSIAEARAVREQTRKQFMS